MKIYTSIAFYVDNVFANHSNNVRKGKELMK